MDKNSGCAVSGQSGAAGPVRVPQSPMAAAWLLGEEALQGPSPEKRAEILVVNRNWMVSVQMRRSACVHASRSYGRAKWERGLCSHQWEQPWVWRCSDLVQGFIRVGLCPRKKGFTVTPHNVAKTLVLLRNLPTEPQHFSHIFKLRCFVGCVNLV